MVLSKRQAKMLGIEQTLDLKEIMLESEWYYKVHKSFKNELFVYGLYAFAIVWVIHTVIYFYNMF